MELNEETCEIVCSTCKGTGELKDIEYFDLEYKGEINKISGYTTTIECWKCHGTGKVDWIENIVGKKKEKIKLNPYYMKLFKHNNPLTSIALNSNVT